MSYVGILWKQYGSTTRRKIGCCWFATSRVVAEIAELGFRMPCRNETVSNLGSTAIYRVERNGVSKEDEIALLRLG